MTWDRTITVPFSPETTRSGVSDTSFYKACWYRREVAVPPLERESGSSCTSGRSITRATVWIDRALAGTHIGGYTPFTIDVTAFLDGRSCMRDRRSRRGRSRRPGASRAASRTGSSSPIRSGTRARQGSGRLSGSSGCHRRGLERSAGAPVWSDGTSGSKRTIAGQWRDGLRLGVKLHLGDQSISDDTYGLTSPEIARRIALSDPGIDDSRNELLWSTASPTLISVTLQLWADRGELLDEATSYTAIRSVTTQGDRFLLNGRPFPLRLVLDQGYWEGSGITAPDDQALRRDVELVESHGVQRRPQASEGRGSPLLVLGRPAGPAGLGGDAERLPLHVAIGRAADPGMAAGHRARREPSLHRRVGPVQRVVGRTRIFRTIPPNATTSARCIT